MIRAGVLIIGSLLWDKEHRDSWRRSHLRLDEKVHVKVSIRYGRRSGNRGDTFTMTLSPDKPLGQAVVVSCARIIEEPAGMIAEAQALWRAERPQASQGSIGAPWGCVGALFRDERAHAKWRAAWREYFRSGTTPVAPVNDDGTLCIPWPLTASESKQLQLDVILATSTKAETPQPTAAEIADAWLDQHEGHERYFLENVRHGIRTSDDALIWRRIKERRPSWLMSKQYAEAVAILHAEATGEARMNRIELDSFPPEVSARLRTYVYRLIDPRNGETFYIGKGQGDRVFSHVRAQVEGDELDNKIKRIREIRVAGFDVAHVIHRHGLDEKTAFEVEAALIDAYPGLTNIVGGAGSSDFGAMHAKEIVTRYCAEPAVFEHKALLISVNRTATETSLYEATRYAWKISKSKAEKAEVVLATRQGLIIEAFIADRWLEATTANFPGRTDVPGRLGFIGHEAPADLRARYVGKRVPDEYRKRGAANPIKYTWSG